MYRVAIGFTSDEIAIMGDPEFPEFMDALLSFEYSFLGVSPQDIKENWHRYRGDGGVDNEGTADSELDVTTSPWIRWPEAVWQYKAGRSFKSGHVKMK